MSDHYYTPPESLEAIAGNLDRLCQVLAMILEQQTEQTRVLQVIANELKGIAEEQRLL